MILKPDALERNLVGAIIDRYERAGLKIADMHYYRKVNISVLRKHYPDSMAEGLGKKAQLAAPGIKDPVVDALATAIPTSQTRGELVATTRALDRVLMAGHYIIPFYYLGADYVAYWKAHAAHPDIMPVYGTVRESWWSPAQ